MNVRFISDFIIVEMFGPKVNPGKSSSTRDVFFLLSPQILFKVRHCLQSFSCRKLKEDCYNWNF